MYKVDKANPRIPMLDATSQNVVINIVNGDTAHVILDMGFDLDTTLTYKFLCDNPFGSIQAVTSFDPDDTTKLELAIVCKINTDSIKYNEWLNPWRFNFNLIAIDDTRFESIVHGTLVVDYAPYTDKTEADESTIERILSNIDTINDTLGEIAQQIGNLEALTITDYISEYVQSGKTKEELLNKLGIYILKDPATSIPNDTVLAFKYQEHQG